MTTLAKLQSKISAEFDQSGSTVNSSTTEYSRRTTILNDAADVWRNYLKGRWTVLKTTTSLSTTASQNYVTLPAGYTLGKELLDRDGTITIGSLKYRLTTREKLFQFDTLDNLVWIEGNDVQGYKMYIQPTPASVVSFTFNYYTKNAATDGSFVDKEELENPTDCTKVPDPSFLVDYALGRLFKGDDEMTKGATYSSEALSMKLNQMVLQQADSDGLSIETSSELQGYEPIGGDNDL